MICYCKAQIPEGDRKIHVQLDVDWGETDERENVSKDEGDFCSFQCVADWAADRAGAHDGHRVYSPDEGHEESDPVVDSDTDTIIRGGTS